jgi:hypothetical protein
LREGNYLERLRVDGKKISKWIVKKWDRGMDWIAVALNRDTCWAIGNVVMDLWGSKICREFLDQLRIC